MTQEVLDEFEIISQGEYYYKDIKLFLDKINTCNNKIYELSETTNLFQLGILGKIYKAEKDLLKLENENLKDIDLFILNSINFYKKIINFYEKIKHYIIIL